MTLPFCKDVMNCAAKVGGTGHCRSCAAIMRNADPAARARMSEAKKRALQDPEKRARVAAAGTKNLLAGRQGVDYSASLRAFAARLTPEQRSKHFGRQGHARGFNGDDRRFYETLKRKGVPAREARAMVIAEARRSIARIREEQIARAARQKAQAY